MGTLNVPGNGQFLVSPYKILRAIRTRKLSTHYPCISASSMRVSFQWENGNMSATTVSFVQDINADPSLLHYHRNHSQPSPYGSVMPPVLEEGRIQCVIDP